MGPNGEWKSVLAIALASSLLVGGTMVMLMYLHFSRNPMATPPEPLSTTEHAIAWSAIILLLVIDVAIIRRWLSRSR